MFNHKLVEILSATLLKIYVFHAIANKQIKNIITSTSIHIKSIKNAYMQNIKKILMKQHAITLTYAHKSRTSKIKTCNTMEVILTDTTACYNI